MAPPPRPNLPQGQPLPTPHVPRQPPPLPAPPRLSPPPTAGDGPCPPLSGRLFSVLTLPLRDDATGYGLTWRPRWVTGARWVSSSEARTNMGPVPRPSTRRAPCLPGPSLVRAHPSCRPASEGGFAAQAPEESLVPAWGGRAGGLLWPAAARSGRSDVQLIRPGRASEGGAPPG